MIWQGLRLKSVQLELLTDPDMHLFVEKSLEFLPSTGNLKTWT